jgi:predicted DNA-binding protein (UPF0251 family)
MTVRMSIDAWLERFFRRRASLANPISTMGPQLERIKRQSTNSEGRKFVKQRTRPIFGAVDCPDCPGDGSACERCGGNGKVGKRVGEKFVEYLVCKDDSAAHNAAHRTDEMYADHGADLMVWASLDDIERQILTIQREPVMCDGHLRRPRRLRPIEKMVCEHGGIAPLDEGHGIGLCRDCNGVFDIDTERQPLAQLVCRSCGLQEAVDLSRDGEPLIRKHVRRIRLRVERKLADRRDGDGSELIRPLVVDAEGFCAMYVYEMVKRHNEDIAEEFNISESQLRRIVSAARAKIERRLRDEDAIERDETTPLPRSVPIVAPRIVESLIDRLRSASLDTRYEIVCVARRWGIGEEIVDTDGAIVGIKFTGQRLSPATQKHLVVRVG